MNESQILFQEEVLRKWFTRDADTILFEVDGLDIGWGGVQRWATRRMPSVNRGMHLDFACGFGTFLAQLGWRFPDAQLIGLNIDFSGPHSIICELLNVAGVNAPLVLADARYMPFADAVISSMSCFLGLQDVEIGFGWEGVRAVIFEAVRVLQSDGIMILLEEFSYKQFDDLCADLPIIVLDKSERSLDVRWDRQVAERAIHLFAEGWVTQSRCARVIERQQLYCDVHTRLRAEMEKQLSDQGYYVPFGPIRMVISRKQ